MNRETTTPYWRPSTGSTTESPIAVDDLRGEDLDRAILSELRKSHEHFVEHAVWMSRRVGVVLGLLLSAFLLCGTMLLTMTLSTKQLVVSVGENTERAVKAERGIEESGRVARLMQADLSLQSERHRVLIEHLNAVERRLADAVNRPSGRMR